MTTLWSYFFPSYPSQITKNQYKKVLESLTTNELKHVDSVENKLPLWVYHDWIHRELLTITSPRDDYTYGYDLSTLYDLKHTDLKQYIRNEYIRDQERLKYKNEGWGAFVQIVPAKKEQPQKEPEKKKTFKWSDLLRNFKKNETFSKT